MVFLAARQAGQFLLKGKAVFGVTDGVHNRVVNSIALGEERSPDSEDRADHRFVCHAGEVDDQVWGPCNEPQRDGGKSNLGQSAFSGSFLSFFTSERFDTHLLGLFSHLLFVSEHSADDLRVSSNDDKERKTVGPGTVQVEVRLGEGSFSEVISSASSQVAFRHVSVPSKEGEKTPNQRQGPTEEDSQHSSFAGEGLSRNSLNDNIVTIHGDEDHGPDRAAAKQRSKEAIDLTEEGTEYPGVVVAVHNHGRELSAHHEEVRGSQVDNQQVGRASQALCVHKHPDDNSIAKDG